MPNIYYQLNGRLGNNIFQHLAAYELSIVLDYTFKGIYSGQEQCISVGDTLWNTLCTNYINCNHDMLDMFKTVTNNASICLTEYYQLDKPHLFFREKCIDYILNTKINNEISNIGLSVPTNPPSRTELIVHLRLDDFNHSGNATSNIINVQDMICIIKKTKMKNIRIVVDTLKTIHEKKYVETIKHECSLNGEIITVQHSSIVDDFNTLRHAYYLITSNSTFAWIAAFLNKNILYCWVCDTKYYNHAQLETIGEHSELCIVTKMDIHTI